MTHALRRPDEAFGITAAVQGREHAFAQPSAFLQYGRRDAVIQRGELRKPCQRGEVGNGFQDKQLLGEGCFVGHQQ